MSLTGFEKQELAERRLKDRGYTASLKAYRSLIEAVKGFARMNAQRVRELERKESK